jgi:hypothetical protein
VNNGGLDGRQRLTALAIAFGGLRETDGKMSFSGSWFLDLDAEANTDKMIVYKKKKEVNTENLNNLSQCISRGLFPLDHPDQFQDFLAHIHDPTRYPNQQLPDHGIRTARATRLGAHSKNFLEFQIPVAELPSSVSLAEVCEIFDVLNQTGTRVSTFDLLHNVIFSDTDGQFELRTMLRQWSTDWPSFGLFCSESRADFLCQVVTGCYLSETQPPAPRQGRGQNTSITSVKGGDLLATPTSFYEKFAENVGAVDSHCSTLFSRDVLGTRASLADLPYPISIILYLSLCWAREFGLPPDRQFSPSRLSKLFRAFFWSNVFSGRYDQGFLTQFSTDRRTLLGILEQGRDLPDHRWPVFADEQLDLMFSGNNRRRSRSDLAEVLLDGNLRGAAQDGLSLFLFSQITHDITDGELLDRFTAAPGKQVDLHHIYPVDWCKNNAAHHPVLQDPNRNVVNSYANLTPLRSETNKQWKTREPMTAFGFFTVDVDLPSTRVRLAEAFIDDRAIDAIRAVNVEAFLTTRAKHIAEELYRLQFVGANLHDTEQDETLLPGAV